MFYLRIWNNVRRQDGLSQASDANAVAARRFYRVGWTSDSTKTHDRVGFRLRVGRNL